METDEVRVGVLELPERQCIRLGAEGVGLVTEARPQDLGEATEELRAASRVAISIGR